MSDLVMAETNNKRCKRLMEMINNEKNGAGKDDKRALFE